jgi:predicted  nucleic acid-binding Zn-ribbon protein
MNNSLVLQSKIEYSLDHIENMEILLKEKKEKIEDLKNEMLDIEDEMFEIGEEIQDEKKRIENMFERITKYGTTIAIV